MKFKPIIAVLTVGLISFPLYAQQQSQQTEQTQSPQQQQEISQEQSQQEGAVLYLSPVTIQRIQQMLNNQGYNAGPVDGQWGPKTKSAMQDFQQAQGLDASGKLNPDTLSELGFNTAEFAAFEVPQSQTRQQSESRTQQQQQQQQRQPTQQQQRQQPTQQERQKQQGGTQ